VHKGEKMSRFLPYPVLTLFLGLGCILMALIGLITWTTRISFRLGKVYPPKLKFLVAIAFLQVLLGVLTVFALKAIKDDPIIDLGVGLGMTFLSGLFLQKLMIKTGWRQCLRVWSIATLIQLVLVPVCSLFLLVGLYFLLLFLFPPQF
jgi:hypothetical protein